MKASEFSVKHPVIITMSLIVLLVFGLYSVSGMVIEFMTDISMPQAIVYAIYPGAAAEDMESDVTKILEDNFVTLPDFKSVDSTSSNSLSIVTITYADGIDPYDQLEELRNRIEEIKEELPEGITDIRAIVGGITMLPIIEFTVEAGEDTGRTSEFIKKELTPRITRIDGVSQVSTDGDKELQVNIKLNTDELASKGISVASIYQVLNYGNVNVPLGNAIHNQRNLQISYAGGFDSIEDIKSLPVGVADKTNIIRLSDVADVELSYPAAKWYVENGKEPLIKVSVTKRGDGNTLKISKEIKSILNEITEETEGAVKFHIISDDARSVKASLSTVIESGIMGIIFAIIVILLFMADWRATITIGLSIPLCILFSFIGLKICGISINLMSLSGLVISLGMVVDGSTVMIDQIYRYYKERKKGSTELVYTVNQAIYKGWDEVAASIFASTATTLVVFIPIALLNGLIGMILHAVAITIIMAMSASFVVAVIVVPYLLKLLLSPDGPRLRAKPRKFDLAIDKLEEKYKKLLELSIDNKKFVIITAICLLLLTGLIATRMGLAFIPSTDSGDFYVNISFPNGTTLEDTKIKMDKAATLIYDSIPEIDNCIFTVGQNGKVLIATESPECASVHIILTPVKNRKRGVHEIMFSTQKLLSSSLPDSTVSVSNGGFDRLVGYVSGGGGYGLILISEDTEELYNTASRIKEFLETDPEVVTCQLNSDYDRTTLMIDMSQDYLSSLGITSYEAGITSAILFQGVDTGKYKDLTNGERYNIHLCSDIKDEDISTDKIADLHIITQKGQNVSFASLSDIKNEKSISQINRTNRARTITISASLNTENTAGVNKRVNEYLKANPLPDNVDSAKGGIMELIGDMIPPMITALLIAVFLVYTVMVMQFEKFRQPLLIMATIPFCFIGVVLGLLMFGSTMNMLAMMGLISLSGVVVNNGIILIDYINLLRNKKREDIANKRGKKNKDGVIEVELSIEEEEKLLRTSTIDGSASRIRPIFITTLTTLLGCIPMAVSHGEGAEIYAPMGQAISGGLLTSTLITLILIPVLYYMSEYRALVNKKKNDLKKKERMAKYKEKLDKINMAVLLARGDIKYKFENKKSAEDKKQTSKKTKTVKKETEE